MGMKLPFDACDGVADFTTHTAELAHAEGMAPYIAIIGPRL